MAGVPTQAGQQPVPEYMQHQRAQRAQYDSSGGFQGVGLDTNKFEEGASHFRILPSFEAIQLAKQQLAAGEQQPQFNIGAAMPYMQLYMPAREDGDSKGISAFGNAVKLSPRASISGTAFDTEQPDPIQDYLENPAYGKLRYTKVATLNPLEKAIRAALVPSERACVQIVNFGKDGAKFMARGDANKVTMHMVSVQQFNEGWQWGYLDEPYSRGLFAVDPFWGGFLCAITRTGQGIQTRYGSFHACYGPPYQQANAQHGYPMAIDAAGNLDSAEIWRLLDQVKPWHEVFEQATPDELQNALDNTLKLVTEKFASQPAQVPAVGIPGQGQTPPPPPGATAAPAPQVAPPQTPAPPPPGAAPAPPPPGAPIAAPGVAPPPTEGVISGQTVQMPAPAPAPAASAPANMPPPPPQTAAPPPPPAPAAPPAPPAPGVGAAPPAPPPPAAPAAAPAQAPAAAPPPTAPPAYAPPPQTTAPATPPGMQNISSGPAQSVPIDPAQAAQAAQAAEAAAANVPPPPPPPQVSR